MLIPVMLSGGVGSRLWPVSRQLYPKQFLNLGSDEYSMLQQTWSRVAELPNLGPAIVVCNEAHRFLVAEQLRKDNLTPQSIILDGKVRGLTRSKATSLRAQSA